MSIQKNTKPVAKKSIKNKALKQDQLNAALGSNAAVLPDNGADLSLKNGTKKSALLRKRKTAEEEEQAQAQTGTEQSAAAAKSTESAATSETAQPIQLAQAETSTKTDVSSGLKGSDAETSVAETGATSASAGFTTGEMIALGALGVLGVGGVTAIAVSSSNNSGGGNGGGSGSSVAATAPVYQSMAVHSNGGSAGAATIELLYDATLDSANKPAPTDFSVTTGTGISAVAHPGYVLVNGVLNQITRVDVIGNKVVLHLATALTPGAVTVEMHYIDPTTANDAAAIQSVAGIDAADIGITSGIVADGYIRGAQMYLDTGNGLQILNGVVTDANGNFFLPAGSNPNGYALVAVGGVNIDTGLPNTANLKAPAGATTINPLTTLVAAVMASSGTTATDAAAKVADALGITTLTGSNTLLNYDPLSNNDTAIQKAAAQVATVIALATSESTSTSAATVTAATVVSNLATAISNAVTAGADLNLADSTVLSQALNNVTVSTATQSAIADAAVAINSATNIANISAAQSQFLDKIAPDAPTSLSATAVTNDTTPTVRVNLNVTSTDGKAAVVGDKVTLMVDGVEAGTATVSAIDIANGYVDVTASTLAAGSHSISAKLIDQSGNTGIASAAITTNIDTQGPTAIISSSNGKLNIVFSEAVDGFAVGDITVPNGVTLGTLSAPTTLSDGSVKYTVSYTAASGATGNISLAGYTDVAGNTGATSNTLDVTNLTAPVVMIKSIGGTDSKVSGQTGDNVVTGIGEPGLDVTIKSANTVLGTATADTNGVWSYALTSSNITTLGQGADSITAEQTKTTGNTTATGTSSAFSINIDTDAPTGTTINAVATNNAINAAEKAAGVAVSGTGTSGDTITLTLATGDVKQVTVANGTWTYTLTDADYKAIGAGSTITAVETDTAGNAGTAVTQPITVDTTAPALGQFSLASGSNTGLAALGMTNQTAPTINFAAESGSAVSVYKGSTLVGTATESTQVPGTYTFTFASTGANQLAQGSNSIKLVATDTAGNSTERTGTIKVDSVAPTVAITDNESATTANIAGGDITYTFTFSEPVTGFTAADVVVANGAKGTFTAVSPTVYTLVVTPTAGYEGNLTVDIAASAAQDVAGNNSTVATQSVQAIDMLAPVVAASNTITTNTGSATTITSGGLTKDNTLALTGTVSDGSISKVEIYDGATKLGEATISSGAWSFTTSTLADGAHSFTAKAIDTAGNSTTTAVITATVDTTAPGASPIGAIETDTGLTATISSGGLTKDNTITLRGATDTTGIAKVEIYDGSTKLGDATVGVDGYWVFTTAALADGAHSFTAKAIDNAGNSTTTAAVTANVDTAAPTVAASSTMTTDTGAAATIASGGLTKDNTLALTGTVSDTVGVSKVEIYDGATKLGDATVSNGTWSFTTNALNDGAHSITAKAIDTAGNSTTTSAITANVDASGPVFTSAATSSIPENATQVAYTAATADAHTVTYSLKNTGDYASFSIDANTGAVSLNTPANYEVKNSYAFTVIATDAAGNVTEKPVTLNISDVNDAPTAVGSIPTQIAVTNQAFTSDLHSYFADVDAGNNGTLHYAITAGALPTGISLNTTTGVLSGTATADATASNFTITATDGGGLSVAQQFSLGVVSAPVVQSFSVADGTTSNGATLGKAGEALTFAVTLSEAVTTTGTLTAVFTVNGQDVTATASAVTGQNTINFTGATVPTGNNGTAISLKSLTSTAAITGDVSHQPMVAPTAGGVTYAGYKVDNIAPTVTSTTIDMPENSTAGVALSATDASTVSWALGSGGDNALFDLASNGTLSLKAAKNYEADATSYTVNVVATDAAGNAKNQAITVNLTNVNEAPVISSGATATFAENATGTVYTTTATDPDAGTTLTYSLTGADASLFNISSAGVVSFKNTPNFEAPADAGADNIYNVTVNTTDGTLSATKDVAITVTNVNEAPTVSNAIADKVFVIGGAIDSFVVPANTFGDPDASTTLTYSATLADGSSLPSWLSFDASTRTFSGNPTSTGVIAIKVTASDGLLSANDTFNLSSLSAPTIESFIVYDNVGPTGFSNFTNYVNYGKSGDTIDFKVKFTEELVLTGSQSAIPTITFTVGGQQIVATYLGQDTTDPTCEHFQAVAPNISGNAFELTAFNLNGAVITGKSTGLSFVPTLNQTYTSYTLDNAAPTVTESTTIGTDTGAETTISSTGLTKDNTLALSGTISDTVAVDMVEIYDGATKLGAATLSGTGNSRTWNFTTAALADGAHSITAKAYDMAGNIASSSAVTVNVDATKPVFSSADTASVAENTATAVYTAATTDAHSVSYSLSGTDAGLFNIVSSTGAVTFKTAPNFEAPTDSGSNNVYNFTVVATDIVGNANNKDVALTVANVNEAPITVGSIGAQTAVVNQAYTADLHTYFSDVDADANGMLHYTITSGTLPTGLSLDANTGVLSGTATSALSSTNFTIAATDGGGLSAEQSFGLAVVNAPTLAAVQALDGVTNLSVQSGLTLAFNQSVTLGSGHIKIYDDMGTSGWAHTNSTTGESVVDTYDNDVDITLLNGSVTAVTIGGVDYTSRFDLATSVQTNGSNLIIDLKQAVASGPGIVSNGSTAFDWDFGANYHVNFDAGIVKNTSGLSNAALTDSTTLNFTTVAPTNAGAASQIIDSSDSLLSGLVWINGNQSANNGTSPLVTIDLSGKDAAVVLDSNGGTTTSGGLQLYTLLKNFGYDSGALVKNDYIYMDNHGNQALATTDGVSGWAGWSSSSTSLTGSSVNSQAMIGDTGSSLGTGYMYFDLALHVGATGSTYTSLTSDQSFESANRAAYNAFIFG